LSRNSGVFLDGELDGEYLMAEDHSRILCIGDIALDVIAELDGVQVENLRYGSDTPSRVRTYGGGAAANVAAWLTETDAKALLVARIGDDAIGQALVSELAELGVENQVIVVPDLATATVVVLVDQSGERTMIPDSGANAGLSEVDLPALHNINAAYISGYALFNPISHQGVHRIFASLRAANIPIIFDPASVGTIEKFIDGDRELLLKAIPYSDVMILNQSEAHFLADCEDDQSALEILKTLAHLVVIKLGDRGAIAFDGHHHFADRGEPVGAIDSTGAGDSFAAGFISSWAKDKNVDLALTVGNRLASRSVRQLGARPPRRNRVNPSLS